MIPIWYPILVTILSAVIIVAAVMNWWSGSCS
jgi:hypothetical protein